MKITGIIVEYNPFHYGHLYHLQQARLLTDCDLLVAVMSSNIVQRGELSCIDKFSRTDIALQFGVDVVLELPAIFALQNATMFAQGAVKMLATFGVDTIVFGSECNNLEYLHELSQLNINVEHIKEAMKQGVSYPSAVGSLSKAMYPNDILGVAYLKAIQQYPSIKALTIQRTNHYHDQELNDRIASASAIRNGLMNGSDVTNFTPMEHLSDNFVSNYMLYPFIRMQLLMSDPHTLAQFILVDEGIENLLIEAADKCDSYSMFIDYCTSRRYTKSRIQRTVMCILLQLKRKDKLLLESDNKPRVLGFNKVGQQYLRQLSIELYGTVYGQLPAHQRRLEYKIAQIYSIVSNNPLVLKLELGGPIIKKAA